MTLLLNFKYLLFYDSHKIAGCIGTKNIKYKILTIQLFTFTVYHLHNASEDDMLLH